MRYRVGIHAIHAEGGDVTVLGFHLIRKPWESKPTHLRGRALTIVGDKSERLEWMR